MGDDLQTWRAKIGCYQHGKPRHLKGNKSDISGVLSLSIRICLFVLLTVCLSVETNPGPHPGEQEAAAGRALGEVAVDQLLVG